MFIRFSFIHQQKLLSSTCKAHGYTLLRVIHPLWRITLGGKDSKFKKVNEKYYISGIASPTTKTLVY